MSEILSAGHPPKLQNRIAVFRAAIFLIPAIIYLPTFLGGIAFPSVESQYSDLLISHYPYLLYLRESIFHNHQIPLWSTLIHSGAPFAANPLAGLFYPPGWIAMLFPLPSGLSINIALHVVFGTWGMYRFLVKRGISDTASILGALSFGLMPKLAAHFGAGHVSLIYAISWTPWLFCVSETDDKGWKSGIIAGLLFLADPRWSIIAGVFWLSYRIAYRHSDVINSIWFFFKTGLVAFLICSPLILPMAEYVRKTSRAALSAEDILFGSLPPKNIIGAIIPGSGGNTEWYLYSGGSILALLISLFFIRELRKTNRFWTVWVGVSLLFATGFLANEPEWISQIPILNILRVPARNLFLMGFCLAVIASITFDYLVVKTKGKNGSGILPFSIIATGTILLIGLIVLVQDQTIQILWGVLAFIITGVIIFVAIKPGYNKYLDWIMVGVLVIDLVGAGLQAYHVDEKGSQILGRALSELDGKQGDFRFYSPSFSIEQHLAAEFDLELADGVDPMQLSSYVNFMEDATGVEQDSYSVTIPAFETGNPAVDNIQAVPDSALLGLLNVKYVVSEFAVAAPGLELFRNQDDLYIYKNGNFRPRAWIEAPDGDGSILAPAEILNKSPNRIIVEATGPGVLVVSEIQYPGWQVYVDGERESIEISREILRSVTLGDGKHQIEFRFRPASVYFGIILSACGWMIAVYVLFRRRFFVMKNDLRDE